MCMDDSSSSAVSTNARPDIQSISCTPHRNDLLLLNNISANGTASIGHQLNTPDTNQHTTHTDNTSGPSATTEKKRRHHHRAYRRPY